MTKLAHSNLYNIYLGCLTIETNSLNREGIYTLVVSNVHGSSNRSLDVKFHNQGPNISTNTAEKNNNMDQSEYITFWVYYCTLIVLLLYYNYIFILGNIYFESDSNDVCTLCLNCHHFHLSSNYVHQREEE